MTQSASQVESPLARSTQRWLVTPLLMAARIALVALCVMTFADIAGRHVLGLPISGIIELVELALVWSAFAGMAVAFWTSTHVSVELIDLLVSRSVLAVMDLLNAVIVFGVMTLLTVLAAREFLDKLSWADRTVDLALPYTWFWAAVVVGYAASTVLVAVGAIVIRQRPTSVWSA